MIFSHNININDFFTVPAKTEATVCSVLANPIFAELWSGYCFKSASIEFIETDDVIFRIGTASKPSLDGNDYAVSITKDGICIASDNEHNLIYGFMTLLDLIQMDEDGNVILPVCEFKEKASVKMRSVHFCVFPETKLYELERFIRLCAVLKYTHIVLEFWGMLKLDCLKELSWNEGYTKDEIRPLIKLANDLGLEIIPMFNHWGHASGCRVIHGKHVVLNQNPSLQYYFNDTGWNWNFKSEKTNKLLRSVRSELMELCGNGQYFHIGCDEAYGFEHTKEGMDEILGYINTLSDELAKYGRRLIMWGDMLLCNDKDYKNNDSYIASCPDKESQQYMLNALNKNIIIADWQYGIHNAPIETSLILNVSGYDVVISPWDMALDCISATEKTISKNNLFGVLHTTWNTLTKGYPYITDVAKKCWNKDEAVSDLQNLRLLTAVALRKCYNAADYEKSGWSTHQTSEIMD